MHQADAIASVIHRTELSLHAAEFWSRGDLQMGSFQRHAGKRSNNALSSVFTCGLGCIASTRGQKARKRAGLPGFRDDSVCLPNFDCGGMLHTYGYVAKVRGPAHRRQGHSQQTTASMSGLAGAITQSLEARSKPLSSEPKLRCPIPRRSKLCGYSVLPERPAMSTEPPNHLAQVCTLIGM